MATYNLGKIGMNPRGAYSASATYDKLDVVTYNSSSYMALAACTGVAPTDSSKWMVLADGTLGIYFDKAANVGTNPLFVVPGEQISFTDATTIPGYVTSSKKNVFLSVPIGKFLTNVTTATVNTIVGWVRNDGGYGLTSGYADAGNDYTSSVKATIIDYPTNTVRVQINRSSSMSLTNNQPVTFVPKTFTMTFS